MASIDDILTHSLPSMHKHIAHVEGLNIDTDRPRILGRKQNPRSFEIYTVKE